MNEQWNRKLQQLLGLPHSPDWQPPPDLQRMLNRLLDVRKRGNLYGMPSPEELSILVTLYLERADGGKQPDTRPRGAAKVRR